MGGGSLNCLAVLLVRSSRVFVDLPSWAGQAGLRELLEGLREACVATVATHLIRNFGPARQPSAKIRVDDGRRCAWRPVVAGAGASAAVLAGSARPPVRVERTRARARRFVAKRDVFCSADSPNDAFREVFCEPPLQNIAFRDVFWSAHSPNAAFRDAFCAPPCQTLVLRAICCYAWLGLWRARRLAAACASASAAVLAGTAQPPARVERARARARRFVAKRDVFCSADSPNDAFREVFCEPPLQNIAFCNFSWHAHWPNAAFRDAPSAPPS